MKPKNNNLNFGLDLDLNKKHSRRSENYQLGAVSKDVLREDGQWTEFMPECEIQRSDYDDWMDCVSESEINWEKIIRKLKFNIDFNHSQRFRAKMSGTTRQGNSLYNVADSARNHGTVEENIWPRNRSMDWNSYYSPIPESVKNRGLKMNNEFDINYEQVPTDKESLKQSLKYGPVQVIGYAWAIRNGLYYDYGYRPNHAFLLVGYVEGKYWIVYDSYPTDNIIDNNSTKQEFVKYLDWDYKFGDAMLYSMKLKTTDRRSWLYKIINMLKNLKMNFFVDKNDPSKGMADGSVYIVKDGKKKKVDDINDIMAVLEINFGIEKTDWGELANYQTVDKF